MQLFKCIHIEYRKYICKLTQAVWPRIILLCNERRIVMKCQRKLEKKSEISILQVTPCLASYFVICHIQAV